MGEALYSEPGTPALQAIFGQGASIASASLGVVEVVAALSAKRRASEIDLQQLDRSLGDLDDDWSGFIQVPLSAETVEKARALARDHALRGADAVHLASAVMLCQRIQDPSDRVLFVVSDHRLKKGAPAGASSWPGITVWDPCDSAAPPLP